MTSLKDIKALEFILFSIFSAEELIVYIYFEALGIKFKNPKVVWKNIIYVNILHTCVYIVYIFICIIS